jgi:hypothetical protein
VSPEERRTRRLREQRLEALRKQQQSIEAKLIAMSARLDQQHARMRESDLFSLLPLPEEIAYLDWEVS